MRLPGNTRPGSCAMPIEPGELCERELPCDARLELKWWRLIAPEKPLPFEVAVTYTNWPAPNVSAPTTSPALNLARSSAGTLNSFSTTPDSTPALARWPAIGFVQREPRRVPRG